MNLPELSGHDILLRKRCPEIPAEPLLRDWPVHLREVLAHVLIGVSFGMPVEVAWEDATTDVSLPKFRPIREDHS